MAESFVPAESISRRKLWVGFMLLCASAVVWMIALKWTMASIETVPMVPANATSEQIAAAMSQRFEPAHMMNRMMMGYAVSGVVFFGGLIVTVMGLIDYAAEVRSRRA